MRNKINTLIIVIVIGLFAVMANGCDKTDDDILSAQRKNMISYLNAFIKSLADKGFDTTSYENVDGVFRYVINKTREGYDQSPIIAKNDSVDFWFIESLFTSKPERIIYSNVPEVIDSLGTGTNFPMYWSRDIMKIKQGRTSLLKGLTKGLYGCREGDHLILLLTADLAYGSKPISTLPKDASVLFELQITKVIKEEKEKKE